MRQCPGMSPEGSASNALWASELGVVTQLDLWV